MIRFLGPAGTRLPAFMLLAFTIVAACSSAPGAPGTPGTPAGSGPAVASTPATSVGAVGALAEMCSLISGEDIATIIDKDLAKTEPGPDGLCSWTFTDSTPGAFAGKEWFVNVSQESDPIPVAMRQGQFALPNGEDVSIGDGGYWAPGLGVLYVQNGADVYDVQLILFTQADPRKDLATEIAQLVLAKV